MAKLHGPFRRRVGGGEPVPLQGGTAHPHQDRHGNAAAILVPVRHLGRPDNVQLVQFLDNVGVLDEVIRLLWLGVG